MAYLVEVYANDKGIQIGAEEIIRALPFGPYWTKVRVGVLGACYASSSLLWTVALQAGVCTGAKAALEPDCIDAVYAGNLGYSGSYPPVLSGTHLYTSQTLATQVWQKVGPTAYYTSGASVSGTRFSATPNAYRSVFTVDITKSTTTNQIVLTTGCQTTTTDISRNQFLINMDTEASPPNTTLSATTVTLVRTARDWNAAFVFWPLSAPAAVIYSMAVTRFA